MSVILTLDPEVKKLWRGTVLGVMTWHASVHGVNPDLWTFYAESVQPGLFGKLQSTELSAMPVMSDNRRAFKSFGIDPGRTRISSEALYRRVRQGKDLYQVNAVVDANNLVSLASGFSLGSYIGQDRSERCPPPGQGRGDLCRYWQGRYKASPHARALRRGRAFRKPGE